MNVILNALNYAIGLKTNYHGETCHKSLNCKIFSVSKGERISKIHQYFWWRYEHDEFEAQFLAHPVRQHRLL